MNIPVSMKNFPERRNNKISIYALPHINIYIKIYIHKIIAPIFKVFADGVFLTLVL